MELECHGGGLKEGFSMPVPVTWIVLGQEDLLIRLGTFYLLIRLGTFLLSLPIYENSIHHLRISYPPRGWRLSDGSDFRSLASTFPKRSVTAVLLRSLSPKCTPGKPRGALKSW
ncbi:hypothetical protein K443DRAFT_458713 [Laccaria amethystina LaAM-08-1]|uniref:Uncharacterized protein n=1 Tax=Laccaria amethystina LaAM-08-1 TaxID=1095629 RepID=A0A0C9Y1K1_9AGAR|nr:hypothetical protein K443DRAFT_458713 [Laccaria amethystina LaAM-08-1]